MRALEQKVQLERFLIHRPGQRPRVAPREPGPVVGADRGEPRHGGLNQRPVNGEVASARQQHHRRASVSLDEGDELIGANLVMTRLLVPEQGSDETIAYPDYVAGNGEAGAREAGKFRLEGKDYVVADGDVMHFRFNN